MQKIIKKENAITLVALIITVIILLILAGITISQLVGNGIFGKVKEAKEKYENKQELENEILENYNKEISKYSRENTAILGELLWTNSDPTASFGSQAITLNSDITKYTHFLLQWYRTTTETTTVYEEIFKLEPKREKIASAPGYCIGTRNSANNAAYVRFIHYVDSTHIQFQGCYLGNASGTWNAACIPYKIYGMNLSY